ncbi:helix-turn-helix domain-containing protein [Nitratireductor sp. CH_MIT9313-5]|uniref:helix-turn-helix domain-containing protein n=1 Tax=Nitratireductor sp. CH_MIT9313-5 TaxID=3107764 RepID=UPI003FA570BF
MTAGKQRRLNHRLLAQVSGVSSNSIYSWIKGKRSPCIRTLIRLAEAVGYELIIIDGGAPETVVASCENMRTAMSLLFDARRARGITMEELSARSGVSLNSLYAWQNESQSPQLQLLVAVAHTLRFRVILRPVERSNS